MSVHIEEGDSSKPAPHPELIVARRNVALASDKLRALQNEALRLSVFVIPFPDRVDALIDMATVNGLFDKFRRDDIEHVIAQGLRGIATLAGNSNGASINSPDRARHWRRSLCKDGLISVRAAEIKSEGEREPFHVGGEIGRLARLGKLEYERERKDAAKRLKIRTPALDDLVAAERDSCNDNAKQGRRLKLPEPEPWPYPVNGAELLDALSTSVRQHVVMPNQAADTVALWAIHTYLLDVFGITPRLAVTSPEKGCGKTTLLDVLSHLVWRPLSSANATASAIFRVVEMHRPTLLIDEGDTFLIENQELRGILNTGHRRGGSVTRTVGDDFEPRAFSTYSSCVIALIGKLPATLADRSFLIDLRRRRADEAIEPFRFDRTEHLDRLARMAARWAANNAESIRTVEPNMPSGLFNRAADNWRPLLAIADVAGVEWPERSRRAAQCARPTDDESVRVLLLTDIRAIFAERAAERLASGELVEVLVAIEGRPWAEWKAGKPITANGLARLLAPFHIAPATIRIGDRTAKGYQLAQFEDAFARYLSDPGF
jgi:putative DNA primase/helicase